MAARAREIRGRQFAPMMRIEQGDQIELCLPIMLHLQTTLGGNRQDVPLELESHVNSGLLFGFPSFPGHTTKVQPSLKPDRLQDLLLREPDLSTPHRPARIVCPPKDSRLGGIVGHITNNRGIIGYYATRLLCRLGASVTANATFENRRPCALASTTLL